MGIDRITIPQFLIFDKFRVLFYGIMNYKS